MLKYALVAEECDAPLTVFLMKMAPRRWFATAAVGGDSATTPAVDVQNALTRAGRIDFQIFNTKPQQLHTRISLVRGGVASTGALLKIRLRDAIDASLQLASVQDNQGEGCVGTWSIDAAMQTVDVRLPTGGADLNCSFTATFRPECSTCSEHCAGITGGGWGVTCLEDDCCQIDPNKKACTCATGSLSAASP